MCMKTIIIQVKIFLNSLKSIRQTQELIVQGALSTKENETSNLSSLSPLRNSLLTSLERIESSVVNCLKFWLKSQTVLVLSWNSPDVFSEIAWTFSIFWFLYLLCFDILNESLWTCRREGKKSLLYFVNFMKNKKIHKVMVEK